MDFVGVRTRPEVYGTSMCRLKCMLELVRNLVRRGDKQKAQSDVSAEG